MEFTTAMTRLLVDRELRQWYRKDPLSAAQKLDVAPESWLPFVNLDPDQLDRQADCLIAKRRYEVRLLIPCTYERMEPKDFRHYFDQYAVTYWPEGENRHLLDAAQFLVYLTEHECAAVVDAELYWLKFLSEGRRLQLRWVNYLVVNGKVRRGIQIFHRFGGQPAWHFYGWPRRTGHKP